LANVGRTSNPEREVTLHLYHAAGEPNVPEEIRAVVADEANTCEKPSI
jgi:hypothetical protein